MCSYSRYDQNNQQQYNYFNFLFHFQTPNVTYDKNVYSLSYLKISQNYYILYEKIINKIKINKKFIKII